MLLPQLQEKENSQEEAILTTNNLAISSMITYSRWSFMFPSCKAVPDTVSVHKYVTDIMQQLIPLCYLYWQIVLLYHQEQLFIYQKFVQWLQQHVSAFRKVIIRLTLLKYKNTKFQEYVIQHTLSIMDLKIDMIFFILYEIWNFTFLYCNKFNLMMSF